MTRQEGQPALRSNLINTLFIAPRAQTDVFDLDYQLYLFVLLHQVFANRWAHFIGITMSMLAYYALGMQFGMLQWVFVAVFAGMHLGMLIKNRLARLIPLALALHAVVWGIAYVGLRNIMTWDAVWYLHPVFHILLWPTVQTITHSLEEKLPPPWGGEKLWAVTRDLLQSSPKMVIVATMLLPMYIFLELISTPRLFFVIILEVARKLRITPDWLQALDQRIGAHIKENHPALALEDFNAVFDAG